MRTRPTGNPEIDRALDDLVLAAVQAALPADVLAALRSSARSRGRSRQAGALQKSSRAAGRPAWSRRAARRRKAQRGRDPARGGAMAAVAAPRSCRTGETSRPRMLVRQDDFRITRFKQRTETTTIFVVDASGSSALHRLAEAKGAVELLLADCYIRRDQVALIAFRGSGAELLLPPTRSLARAKRSLAGLPGGGGTPLAAGTRCGLRAGGSDPPQGPDADGHRADRRPRQHRARRRAGTSTCRGGCDDRRAATGCAGITACWSIPRPGRRFRRNIRQGNGRALSAVAPCRRDDVIESGAGEHALALTLIRPHPLHHLLDMRDRGFRLDAVAEVEDQPACAKFASTSSIARSSASPPAISTSGSRLPCTATRL